MDPGPEPGVAFLTPSQQTYAGNLGGSDGVVRKPIALLTEVLFDQTGMDSQSVFGGEWVELYVARGVDLGRFEITDHLGNALGVLPSVTVPAHSYVEVVLGGLGAYLLDDDPSDGTFSLALGHPVGDILPNGQVPGDGGGVRLLFDGRLLDAVYWGHGSAPAGSQGEYFDLSFAAGRPMNEADSLGRSGQPMLDYTGTIADWDRNGGVQSAGPTPSKRNGVYVSDENSILKWAQTGICGVVNSFGHMTGQSGKYRFLDATVSDIVVLDLGASLSVTATHTFTVNVNRNVEMLSGTLVTTLVKDETPGSVSFERTVSGELTSTGNWGLELDYSQAIFGFHSNVQQATTVVAVVYKQGAQDYPFGHTVRKSLERTSDNVWLLQDDRTGLDYGGGGLKVSAATVTYTRTGDGQISTHFEMLRDMPIGPPMPGEVGSIEYQQRLVSESTSFGNDLGAETTTIQRYDEYEDGVLVASLRPGEVGVASLSFESASQEEPYGSANYLGTLPLLVEGRPRTISNAIRATVSVRSGGVYVGQAEGQMNVNGLISNGFAIWADPPLQGSGSGANSAAQDSGGFGDAAVNCAAKGGAIGAGVGAVAGGVAGAIGGAAVGSAVGSLGGPPGAVIAATAGGVKGAAVGVVVGSSAAGIAGAGIGAAACMTGYGAKKAWRGVKSAWRWIRS